MVKQEFIKQACKGYLIMDVCGNALFSTSPVERILFVVPSGCIQQHIERGRKSERFIPCAQNRWLCHAFYEARSATAQVFLSPLFPPPATWSTYQVLRTTGVPLHQQWANQCWNLAGPFRPPQAADHSLSTWGDSPSHLPTGMVGCLGTQGRFQH